MRMLLAGATGVIGRQAVLVLSAAGHDVIGLARTTRPVPRRQGVTADILNVDATARAVHDPRPCPAWPARIAAGQFGVARMTALRGADNTVPVRRSAGAPPTRTGARAARPNSAPPQWSAAA